MMDTDDRRVGWIKERVILWLVAGAFLLAGFSSVISTINILQINGLQDRQQEDSRTRFAERAVSEVRSCVRDQKEAKAIRQILINSRQNATRDGRLTPRLAVQYVKAIDSIVVPNCSLKALGFEGVQLPRTPVIPG